MMITEVVYAPHYTVMAVVVLLIVPLVFHLVAFRKSIRFLHILTSILVGNFILAFLQLKANSKFVLTDFKSPMRDFKR